MTAFLRAAERLAADRNMGADAVYTPQGEAPLNVRVVLRRPEEDGILGAAATRTIGAMQAMLPASAVPDRPLRDETLQVAGATWKIASAERDDTGSFWTLTLKA